MRIVLDTNVVVSAVLWRGTPFRLLHAIRDDARHQLCSSVPLLDELTDVLSRPRFHRRLSLIGLSAANVVSGYIGGTRIVEPADLPAVVLDDPDDDHVIAAAVAAAADLIVSGDGALLALQRQGSCRIVTPADALALVTAHAAP